jgi:hypothetical protein
MRVIDDNRYWIENPLLLTEGNFPGSQPAAAFAAAYMAMQRLPAVPVNESHGFTITCVTPFIAPLQ